MAELVLRPGVETGPHNPGLIVSPADTQAVSLIADAWPKVVAEGRTHDGSGDEEGAAAENAVNLIVYMRSQLLVVDDPRLVWIGEERALTPVEDVAMHVEQPQIVGPLLTHRPAAHLA